MKANRGAAGGDPNLMSRGMKKVERVRVTSCSSVAGYQIGDKGTVLREVVSTSRGTLYYLVAMDKDDPSHSGVVFRHDEIEPDI
jgi:hypothetical protein